MGARHVYLPTVIPDLAWALVWLWILNPIYGPLNQVLGWFGIDGPAWMVDPASARLGIVLMMIWQLGEGFIICLAALQSPSITIWSIRRRSTAGDDGARSVG